MEKTILTFYPQSLREGMERLGFDEFRIGAPCPRLQREAGLPYGEGYRCINVFWPQGKKITEQSIASVRSVLERTYDSVMKIRHPHTNVVTFFFTHKGDINKPF